MHWIFQALLVALVAPAAIIDARERRIPNWLTLTVPLVALAAHVFLRGMPGAFWCISGFVLGGAVYCAPYLLGWMGGGDVKLMAAAGSILGPQLWLVLFFWSALCGGAIAVATIVVKGRVGQSLRSIGQIVYDALRLRSPRVAHPPLDIHSPAAITTPHGVAIAAATVILLIRG